MLGFLLGALAGGAAVHFMRNDRRATKLRGKAADALRGMEKGLDAAETGLGRLRTAMRSGQSKLRVESAAPETETARSVVTPQEAAKQGRAAGPIVPPTGTLG